MAIKFSLTPNPTFKRDVSIPVPGGKTVSINFTFKHKNRDAFKAFIDSLEGRDDVDIVLDVASGWALDDAFNEENLGELTQNYLGSARAILETYIAELSGARKGN
ncbi:MAG: phage tail assembly chaperone [Pusillimonas sp.]